MGREPTLAAEASGRFRTARWRMSHPPDYRALLTAAGAMGAVAGSFNTK